MLDATLTTAVDDGIEATLAVENVGEEPATLRFRTGKRVTVTARDGGDVVWRSDEGRMFTQALGSETVAPGESVTYGATWAAPPPGEYRLVAELAAENVDVSAETDVRVA